MRITPRRILSLIVNHNDESYVPVCEIHILAWAVTMRLARNDDTIINVIDDCQQFVCYNCKPIERKIKVFKLNVAYSAARLNFAMNIYGSNGMRNSHLRLNSSRAVML